MPRVSNSRWRVKTLMPVLKATWKQFDLNAVPPIWVKPSSHTKQRKMHRVPLSENAAAVLLELQKTAKSTYVFPGSNGTPHRVDLKKPWAAISKAAGLTDVRLHDLRHTYASVLVSAGMSLPIIGRLLGHTQVQTTLRYAHLQDAALKAATDTAGKLLTKGGTK